MLTPRMQNKEKEDSVEIKPILPTKITTTSQRGTQLKRQERDMYVMIRETASPLQHQEEKDVKKVAAAAENISNS